MIGTNSERTNGGFLLRKLLVITLVSLVSNSSVSSKLVSPSSTPTSIQLTWTAPGDDGNVGQATQYGLRYSTSMITEENWDDATVVSGLSAPQIAGNSESFTVNGLNPGTLYYFAIKAADEMPNWSPLSNVVSQSTSPEETSPATIADLTVNNPTESTLTLSWTAPGDDGTTGMASQYDIRYSTSTITEANWASATQIENEPSPQSAGNTETLSINSLEPSTMYYFAIKTADEIPNWSGLSNIASGQTSDDQTPPAAIDDLQASTGDEEGQLNLTWTAPGDDGTEGYVSAYEIRYSGEVITEDNFEQAELWLSPPTPLAGGSQQSLILSNLEPGEIYYAGIRSYDDVLNASHLSNIDSGEAMVELVLDVDDNSEELPDEFNMAQNYPNPFNPTTEIEYSVPSPSFVTITIFNVQGQKTKTIIAENKSAGNYNVQWAGTDDYNHQVASGVYFYRMQAGDFSESKKMVLLK